MKESGDQRGARRRPQWRGERKAVLVRMPVELAEHLHRSAAQEQRSVSDHAAVLLREALDGPGVA